MTVKFYFYSLVGPYGICPWFKIAEIKRINVRCFVIFRITFSASVYALDADLQKNDK